MALAKKTASTMQLPTPPEQCQPVGKINELDAILIWFRDRFTLADDECVKYHENLLVDPFWEVSPMMVRNVIFLVLNKCWEALTLTDGSL